MYLMMPSGREMSPYSEKTFRYQFNGLAANTRHRIDVIFTRGVRFHTEVAGYVDTHPSLCKFPN